MISFYRKLIQSITDKDLKSLQYHMDVWIENLDDLDLELDLNSISAFVLYAVTVPNNTDILKYLVEDRFHNINMTLQENMYEITKNNNKYRVYMYPQLHYAICLHPHSIHPTSSPLLEACRRGHWENARFLITHGCMYDGDSIVHILKRGPIDLLNHRVMKMYAKKYEWTLLLKCLSDRNEMNWETLCPSSLKTQNGDDINEFIAYLIQKCRWDHLKYAFNYFTRLNMGTYMDGHGNTMLHVAAMTISDRQLFQFILKQCPYETVFNRDGHTPVHLAVAYNRGMVIEELVERDVDMYHTALTVPTPIEYLVRHDNNQPLLEYLMVEGIFEPNAWKKRLCDTKMQEKCMNIYNRMEND